MNSNVARLETSFRTLALMGALSLAPCAWAADLKDILKQLGEGARADESSPPCTYRETTTVDELNKEGGVLGSEVRTFDVEVKGMEVTRRDLLSVKKSGQPLADLLQQPRDTKGKKAARGPLHPEAQKDYRFGLTNGPGPDQLTLSIEPLKPSMDRIRGEAVLNTHTSQLQRLRFAPSKVPLLLKSLEMRWEYGDTACGRLPVALETEGEGVAIFIETKFRSRSLLEGHARISRPRTN